MKITYFAAMSSDGYIARENGDVAWLDELGIDPGETGYAEFFATVDGLVMGRATYDFVFSYGSWPYGDKPAWVCAHQPIEAMDGSNLIVVDSVNGVLDGAKTRGVEHLWLVGGGQLASAFVKQGVAMDVLISEMPVALGAGIPVFSEHLLDDVLLDRRVTEMRTFRRIEGAVRFESSTTG